MGQMDIERYRETFTIHGVKHESLLLWIGQLPNGHGIAGVGRGETAWAATVDIPAGIPTKAAVQALGVAAVPRKQGVGLGQRDRVSFQVMAAGGIQDAARPPAYDVFGKPSDSGVTTASGTPST